MTQNLKKKNSFEYKGFIQLFYNILQKKLKNILHFLLACDIKVVVQIN